MVGDGLLVLYQGDLQYIDFSYDVVDTVGAGDAFSAALVMSLLKGQTLREAHECAVKISAFVCSHKGAWPVYE